MPIASFFRQFQPYVCENNRSSRRCRAQRWSNVSISNTICIELSHLELYRREVSFEDGKVLLSRLGDKIHATSAYCTHYGAPLSKGVLTSDGRVVWQVPYSL